MAQPSGGCRGNWKNFAASEAEEEAFDYVKWRDNPKPTGFIGSVAHVIKGALGGGILGGHVAFMKAGLIAMPFVFMFGLYMTYCLYRGIIMRGLVISSLGISYTSAARFELETWKQIAAHLYHKKPIILVRSAQVLFKRTRVPSMSYPDVGEAAMACFPNPKVAKWATVFRYSIDAIICIDLFGACACYQLIIAKSIKQLVENTQKPTMAGLGPGYPDLRVYLAAMIIPVILICLITHLKYLAPFSLVANGVVLLSVFITIYYAMNNNPNFKDLKTTTSVYSFFEFTGMSVFSMSCVGVVIPIENNMKNPKLYPKVLVSGMTFNVSAIFLVSFFGYVGYLDKCESPITVNFPMTLFPKILKALIAMMIYVTHALNFWVPFNLVFYYLKALHKKEHEFKWELIYRAIIVTIIGIVAIVFPTINALMGFLGAFCLSNMAFIWPNMIYLMVVWQRPGLGKYKWRLWKAIILILIGVFVFVCGTVVSINELASVFR